jgi:DNA-binding transcriptional LysR family regulator
MSAASLAAASVLPRRDARLHGQAAQGESCEHMNLAGIDFVSLRLVVLCAELGSLSIAARHAHMSLSCASHRLSTAEEVFGARLFERDHRGLHPTHAGAVFVTHARAILNILRSGLRQVRSASAHAGIDVACMPLSAYGNRA